MNNFGPLKSIVNVDLVPAPAFGLLAPVGVTLNGVLQVCAPVMDSQPRLLVNSDVNLPVQAYGFAHNTFPSSVLCASSDGLPNLGDKWGSQKGSFALRKGYTGFTAIGASQPGLMTVDVDPAPCCDQQQSSTSSSNSSAIGSTQTLCCPPPIANTLCVTVSNLGGCSCVSGNLLINYNATTHQWWGYNYLSGCPGGSYVDLTIYCTVDGMAFVFTFNSTSWSGYLTINSCSPVNMTAAISLGADLRNRPTCLPTGQVLLTITNIPCPSSGGGSSAGNT